MRRICLFAGYDAQNKVQDYVVYLVKKLSLISDVYYMGNSHLPTDELSKLVPYTKLADTCAHQQRCFGSWQRLIALLGWENLLRYDELILCNDSVYGPFQNLENIFKTMKGRGYDFWSMTADSAYDFHLHNYFMVFSAAVIRNRVFQNFWSSIPRYSVIYNCSFELTPLLLDEGFVGNSYIRGYRNENIMQQPQKMVHNFKLPFVKTKSFLPHNKYTAGSGLALRYRIRTQSNYDTGLINAHIKANNLPQSWGQKLAILSGL